MEKLKVVSLFSGMGGMDLGVLGNFKYNNNFYSGNPYKIIYASDNDKYCAQLYNDNFNHKLQIEDIRQVNPIKLPNHDLLIGGFPCKSFSIVAQNPPRLGYENKDGELIDQVNSVGELIYSGNNVSMGYANSINDLELGDVNKGVLRTGDLAKFDSEGFFYIEGSTNRFIKIYGNRISLDSLEKIIFNKGFESAAIGSENKLVIYVIHNKKLSTDLLKVDISEVIGINQTAIQINVVSDFPRLDNGKINYKVIKNIK